MRTILITGFGPFPTAPFNPTEPLVRRLARERQPAVADVKIVPHIFRTSYAAVDRDLPSLLRTHKPDAILMFGLATRTVHLRIETSARNAVAGAADADRHAPNIRVVDRDQPRRLALRTPARRLLASARAAHVPAALSRDAGRYLCNYLCWRATEAAHAKDGPRLAAFIHVPLVRRGQIPAHRKKKNHVTMADLARAGRGFLRVIASAGRR
ncbi:MAG: pyroglutamyl-peptidase I [Rhizobiales bacterium]|nr:pyroglutamyl-peptidase I [Hyphomicrobiales bacterium]